jgi:putative inorganic carbon (hco3(-)) transporter
MRNIGRGDGARAERPAVHWPFASSRLTFPIAHANDCGNIGLAGNGARMTGAAMIGTWSDFDRRERMRNLTLAAVMSVLLTMAATRPFVGVLAWSWISFMNPHQLVWGFSSDMPWALMVFGTTLFGCVVAREPNRWPNNGMIWLVIALMVCISAASLVALVGPEAAEPKWERTIKVLASLLLIAALVNDRWRVHALIWVMALSIGYFGVKGGAFTLITGGEYRVWGPPNTMIEDNNHCAAGLLVTLPLMNYLRLQSRHRVMRIGLACMMGLSLLAIVASYSRGALIGLAVVGLFLWKNSPRKLASAIVVGGGIASVVMFMPDGWMDRMYSIQNYQQDDSSMGRLNIWQASFAMALARPLTGGGFLAPYTQSIVDQFSTGVQARAVHSIYFEILGENGFPAFFVWLSMSILGFVNTIRILRDARGVPGLEWSCDLARMGQVSIIAYLVAGAFLSLSYWDFYLTFLVVMAATRDLVKQAVADSPRGMARWAAPAATGLRVAGAPVASVPRASG